MTSRFTMPNSQREVITISDDDDDRAPRSSGPHKSVPRAVLLRHERYHSGSPSRQSLDGKQIAGTPPANLGSIPRRTNQHPDSSRPQGQFGSPPYHGHPTTTTYPRTVSQPRVPSNPPPAPPMQRGMDYPHLFSQNFFSSRLGNKVSGNFITSKPEPRSYVTVQKRACTFCIELGEAGSCDGGYPCSACVEPNPDGCEYPGETNQRPRTTHNKAGSLATKDSSALNVRVPKSIQAFSTAQQHHSDHDSKILPDFNLTSFDLESVRTLLKRLERQMHMHREYVLQSELLQAQIHCQQSPGPSTTGKHPNPFMPLINKAKAQASGLGQNTGSPSAQIMIKNHRGSGPKKFVPMKLQITYFKTDESAPVLPKYKSIGRLGGSFLARNVHTLKYMPYSAEDEIVSAAQDEKEQELKQRYKSDDEELIKQRKCQEMVYSWRPWLHEMMSLMDISVLDVLYHILLEPYARCRVCGMSPAHSNWQQISMPVNSTATVDPQKAEKVKWMSEVLLEHTSLGLWHVIADTDQVKTMINKAKAEMSHKDNTSMCSICFLPDCPAHGAYRDTSSESARRKVRINDPEVENNARQWTNLGRKIKKEKHQCGFYCVPGKELRDFVHTELYGLNVNGAVRGMKNPSLAASTSDRFSDLKFCSILCFWSIEKRRRFHPAHQELKIANELSEPQSALLQRYISLFADNHRAPCMISKLLDIPCMAVFYKMVNTMYSPPHQAVTLSDTTGDRPDTPVLGGRKVSRLAAGYDTSRSHKLDARKPYVPCDHSGPCLEQHGCTCSDQGVYCEWFCACDDSCKRRFQGCKCKGRRCFNDDRCECWANNRECDPWLCGSCGVVEVLDPNNKYRDDIREGRCQNNRIQLDLPARTIKAPSEVQGWGLYAGQDMDVNTFIGEYKGEVISTKEGDRRGVVYHNIGQEYLFITNSEQQIDGSNFGNKTRFMNNSQLEKNINVLAKNLLSNGVQRVMFYTKRPVKAGEELLYNYNYPDHVVKHFWERGEKPAGKHGVPAPVAKPRIDGRFIKSVAGKQDGEESAARKQEQQIFQREKRKRISDGEDDRMALDGEGQFMLSSKAGGIALETSDDSDYEDAYERTTGESASAEGSNSSTDEQDQEDSAGRKRRIHDGDRRRGGLAQKRAWETRKKNGNF